MKHTITIEFKNEEDANKVFSKLKDRSGFTIGNGINNLNTHLGFESSNESTRVIKVKKSIEQFEYLKL